MTDTEPTTRPIPVHERFSLGHRGQELTPLHLDGAYFALVLDEELPVVGDLLTAAGKVHAVLVDLPSCAGGGQLCTWSYPNGAVEASWRQSARDTWYPVELLDGGSVCVAP